MSAAFGKGSSSVEPSPPALLGSSLVGFLGGGPMPPPTPNEEGVGGGGGSRYGSMCSIGGTGFNRPEGNVAGMGGEAGNGVVLLMLLLLLATPAVNVSLPSSCVLSRVFLFLLW